MVESSYATSNTDNQELMFVLRQSDRLVSVDNVLSSMIYADMCNSLTQEFENVEAVEESRTAEFVDSLSDVRLDLLLAVLPLIYMKMLVLSWALGLGLMWLGIWR